MSCWDAWVDVYGAVKRRADDVDLDAVATCQNLRAAGLTAYLANGGTVRRAQIIACMRARARRSGTSRQRATKSRPPTSRKSVFEMADLTNIGKRQLERFLHMGSGYVLDFSNR